MKSKTLTQVEAAKTRAENFVRQVLLDDERADEIAEETLEKYAERKQIQIVNNPDKRRQTMATKQELEQLVDDQSAYIEELENELGDLKSSVRETLSATKENLESTLELVGEDESEDDDSEGEDEGDSEESDDEEAEAEE
jgi:uncharacterized protein YPO0396